MRNEGRGFWDVGRLAPIFISITILLCMASAGAEAMVTVEGDVPDDGYLYVSGTSDLVMKGGCEGSPGIMLTATWGWGDYKMKSCEGNSCSMKIDISLRDSGTVKLEAFAWAKEKKPWGDCLSYTDRAEPQYVTHENLFEVAFTSPGDKVQARKEVVFSADYSLRNFDDEVHDVDRKLYLCDRVMQAPTNLCRELVNESGPDVKKSGTVKATVDLRGEEGTFTMFVRTCARRSCQFQRQLVEVIPCPEEGCCQVEDISADPSEVYPVLGGGNTKSVITITLKEPAPPDGCTIELKNDPEQGSGGHQHSVNDPPRPRGTLGGKSTVSDAVKLTIKKDEKSGTIKYASSEVSGTEQIKYRIKPDDEKADKSWHDGVEMKVRVPNLEGLSGQHITFKGVPGGHHTDFYNVTATTNLQFRAIAYRYYMAFKKSLQVTDASLKWGGVYDINDNWKPKHIYHRRGTDIDVRTKWGYLPVANRKDFERFVCRTPGVYPKLEDKYPELEHYHLYFYAYSDKADTIKSFCKNSR